MHLVTAELFHTDGQTDGQTDMKITVAFPNFATRLERYRRLY